MNDVFHDVYCPYWDLASLNNINLIFYADQLLLNSLQLNSLNKSHTDQYFDCSKMVFAWFLCLVQVRLGTEVLRIPSSTGVQTHDLQIMTVHFMSLRRLLWPLGHQWIVQTKCDDLKYFAIF